MGTLIRKNRKNGNDRRTERDRRQVGDPQYEGRERRIAIERRVERDRRRIQLMMPEI